MDVQLPLKSFHSHVHEHLVRIWGHMLYLQVKIFLGTCSGSSCRGRNDILVGSGKVKVIPHTKAVITQVRGWRHFTELPDMKKWKHFVYWEAGRIKIYKIVHIFYLQYLINSDVNPKYWWSATKQTLWSLAMMSWTTLINMSGFLRKTSWNAAAGRRMIRESVTALQQTVLNGEGYPVITSIKLRRLETVSPALTVLIVVDLEWEKQHVSEVFIPKNNDSNSITYTTCCHYQRYARSSSRFERHGRIRRGHRFWIDTVPPAPAQSGWICRAREKSLCQSDRTCRSCWADSSAQEAPSNPARWDPLPLPDILLLGPLGHHFRRLNHLRSLGSHIWRDETSAIHGLIMDEHFELEIWSTFPGMESGRHYF